MLTIKSYFMCIWLFIQLRNSFKFLNYITALTRDNYQLSIIHIASKFLNYLMVLTRDYQLSIIYITSKFLNFIRVLTRGNYQLSIIHYPLMNLPSSLK